METALKILEHELWKMEYFSSIDKTKEEKEHRKIKIQTIRFLIELLESRNNSMLKSIGLDK